MDTYIQQFASQLKQSIEIGAQQSISPAKTEIRNIVVSGLGGSGIGGSLVGALLQTDLEVPFSVNNDYFLPNYVNHHTLLIISSYSGNTEETVNALKEGIKANAKIVCISTNGAIEELAKENSIDFVKIPSGIPPRGALNISFPQVAFVLNHLGLCSDKIVKEMEQAVEFLEKNQQIIKEKGIELATQLVNKIPVIYTDDRMAAVAIRFRQQINENGKMLAWHHVFPEMNHNELVGWTTKNEDLAVVFLRNEDDYHRSQKRMEITSEVVKKYTPNVYEVWSKGSTFLEQCLYLINLTDWTSFELAQLTGADAVEVDVINYLKGELAKL